MKTITDTISTTTNMSTGTSKRLEFDAEGTSVLMSILSSLYADTKEAALREYVCNALDARTAAGTDRPVELTLPTALDPVLTVTDYGIGLTCDEVTDIFGTYGASTKRDLDTMIGNFGIGAKVAYAVASQFTVTAVKDGLRCVCLFSKDEQGFAVVDRLAVDIPCDEPSGVTVQVPVDDPDGWKDAAGRALLAVPTGSLLVDGAPHVCELDDVERQGRVQFRDRTRYGAAEAYVVMGPVAYRLSKSQAGPLHEAVKLVQGRHGKDVFVHAEIGEVMPAPSRETLRDNKATTRWIEQVAAEITAEITACVNAIKAKHPDSPSAVMREAVAAGVGHVPLTFPGQPQVGDDLHVTNLCLESFGDGHRAVLGRGIRHWSPTQLASWAVLVTDDLDKVRVHAAPMMVQNGWTRMLVTDKPVGTHGLVSWGHDGDLPVVTHDELAAFGRDRRASRPSRSAGSTPLLGRGTTTYNVYLPGCSRPLHLDAATLVMVAGEYGGKITWYQSQRSSRYPWFALSDRPIVSCTRKVPKRIANKVSVTPYDASYRTPEWVWDEWKTLSLTQKLVAYLAVANKNDPLDPAHLLDPAIRDAVASYVPRHSVLFNSVDRNVGELTKAYPLLPNMYRVDSCKHVVDYLNGQYLLAQHRAAQAA